uniref:Kringle domain-containing protein n=1 Tax=Angiostrongylus cantonensis TaxID=6313 RepID=A0A0K0DCS8_ANGCA
MADVSENSPSSEPWCYEWDFNTTTVVDPGIGQHNFRRSELRNPVTYRVRRLYFRGCSMNGAYNSSS